MPDGPRRNGEEPPRPAHELPGEALTAEDVSQAERVEEGQSMRAQISNAMVALKKRFYGKGPVKAKTYINDNYVFCVLEGGLTRSERTLLDAGEEDLVRTYRLRFEEVMAKPAEGAVEQITGRKVIGYHSQIVFDPAVTVEFFVLDEPVEG